MENYKSYVNKIINLNWESLDQEDLQKLMILSAYSALEFAESLRKTVEMNPNNHALKEMADEELKTDTLSFEDYKEKGDHSDFLWHFIEKYNLFDKFKSLKEIGEAYIEKVRNLPDEIKVMSIVSREQELPGIFNKILTSKNWEADGLKEYKYYLEQHIELDSAEGGHADMLSNFDVDDKVSEFYKVRLEMYEAIPKLFSPHQ